MSDADTPADGSSEPKPKPRSKRAKKKSDPSPPARSRYASKRETDSGRVDLFSFVFKGQPALPFQMWPLPVGTESAAGGKLLPAWAGTFPGKISTREAVHGDDDRQRLTDFFPTTDFPWRALCRLVITATTGKQYLGTGWLISPRVVVTAGHCVYMHRAGGWADRIEVTPAFDRGVASFDSQTTDDLHTSDAWMLGDPDTSSTKSCDYGAIVLPVPFDVGNFGYAVYEDDALSGMTVNVYGYPKDKGPPNGEEGWEVWGYFRRIKGVTAKQIIYDTDTEEGESGCPAFVFDGEEYLAVGIHTYGGNGASNVATRFTNEVYADLEHWKAMGE